MEPVFRRWLASAFTLLAWCGAAISRADVTYAMAISRDHLGTDYVEAREVFRQCVPDSFTSLAPPRYPFIATVSEARADAGHAVSKELCSRCHGEFRKTGPKTYDLVSFPNKLVDHEGLGTDPLRITGVFDMNVEEKKRFLSGKVTTTRRYAAPRTRGGGRSARGARVSQVPVASRGGSAVRSSPGPPAGGNDGRHGCPDMPNRGATDCAGVD